jgi:hypothetical protein
MSMSEQVKIVITTGQPQARITGKGSVSKLEKPKPGGSGWQQKQTKPWKPTRKPTFARDGHFDPTGIPSPPTNIPGPFSGKFAPPLRFDDLPGNSMQAVDFFCKPSDLSL